MPNPLLLPVRTFCERHPEIPEGTIRSLIFNADKNGFDQCIIRIGRKILINVDSVYRWLDEKNGGKLFANSCAKGEENA